MDGYDGDDEYDHRNQSPKKKWSQLLEMSRTKASKYVVAPALTLSTVVLLGLSYYMLVFVILPFIGGWLSVTTGIATTFFLYSAIYFYVMLLKTSPGMPPTLMTSRGNNNINMPQRDTPHNASKTSATRVVRKPRGKKRGQKKPKKWKASLGIDTTHKFNQFPKKDEYNGEDRIGEDNNDDDDEYSDNYDIYNTAKICIGNDEYSSDAGICHKCTSLKVPRSHHCKVCGTCVLKMDHHCTWVGKCVGYFNYRFYFMFMFYVTNYCLLFFILSLPPYILKSSKVN